MVGREPSVSLHMASNSALADAAYLSTTFVLTYDLSTGTVANRKPLYWQ